VISSSLHGLVVADSYHIPCVSFMTHISRHILHRNGQNGFKFKDYYSAFDKKFTTPSLYLDDVMDVSTAIEQCEKVDVKKLEEIKDMLTTTFYEVMKYYK
jgi:hypothetical protein